MADMDPAVTLWRAAELAPKVLPPAMAALVVRELKNGMWWLNKWSSLNEADMEMFEATWGNVAREVLVLAEQEPDKPCCNAAFMRGAQAGINAGLRLRKDTS